MNTLSKTVAMTALLTMMSACSMTTTPKHSTYWIKQGSDYQTHKDRIRTKDHVLACKSEIADRVDAKKLTDEQRADLVDNCMEAKAYYKADNWYDIKEVATK